MNPSVVPRVPDEQVLFEVFRDSPVGIALEDTNGKVLFANPSLCSMLGFTQEQLCEKECQDFSVPEDAERDWAFFQQLRAGAIDHYVMEKRYIRTDGTIVWGKLHVSLLNDRPIPIVVARVEDITQQKRTEAELRQLSRKLIEAQEDERS